MSKLGPEAQELLAVGRQAARPTDADRQRVLQSLRARIAFGPPLTPSAAPSSGASWPLISGLVIGAAILGAIAFQFRDSASNAPAPAAPVHAPSPPSAAPPSPASSFGTDAASPLEPLPAPVRAPAPESKAPPARSTPSSLAEEVALLSRAETELHANRFGSALRLLNEYERKFPRGVMVQEDIAARAQALCGLGRTADAKAELSRLSPSSPLASRARAACHLK